MSIPKTKRRHSIFDYTVTVKRVGRYLVVSCPEFGLQVASQRLGIDHLSPREIGGATIRIFERISEKVHQMEEANERLPKPGSVPELKAA